jgi:aspartate racemase
LLVEDNTTEMVIGMLGIMKAGGAFLPIDQEFPNERIEYLIDDSGIKLILSQHSINGMFSFNGEIISLEEQSLYTGESSNLEKLNEPNDLVYVIYTSGSTGNPKGVQIEHTSIVNQIYGLEQMYDFHDSLNHILLAPFTFDPCVQQVFLPLTSGGQLFLVPESIKHNLKDLWEFIRINKIDIVNTVPSVMSALLDQAGSDNQKFKFVILAGETFSKNLYLRIKETISVEIIINIYGPTEATINTTLYECKPYELNGAIPIGKPLMNYNVLILDDYFKLCPVGVPGEICISGVGLARGYQNNPGLTLEKFVPNPFKLGERMYRTGDLGKWNEGGNIEFVGRVDHQVKINGIRVELGEIESALNNYPLVQESVVVNYKNQSGLARLIAYVVPNQGQDLNSEEMRNFLKDKLPDFMVPSSFVLMESFPLTLHGKVDRKALPDPEQVIQESKNNFVAPRNETETKLVKIWEKVLGIERIGIKDNFFDIGGTSLLSMILFSEIEKTFGKNLPLATIFDAPTIEQLANIVGDKDWAASWSPLVAIQTDGSLPPFFCIHGHRGNVIGYQDLSRLLGKDQPFYALQAEGLDGKPLSERSIKEMAVKYINEIKTVQPDGPYFIGGWCMGGTLAYEMGQLLQSEGQKVALVAMIETNLSSKYPIRKPEITLIQRIYNKIFDRLKYERMLLGSLNNKEKLNYLSRKFKNRITTTSVKIEKRIGKFLEKYGITIPHSWAYKLDALVDNHECAILSYKPLPYSGRIAIFKANNQPPGVYPEKALGWDELIQGELEIHEFPGHHLNAFIEPSLKVLAEKLKISLSEARQTY